MLIWVVDVSEERGHDFSDKMSWELFSNLRRGEPRMQREKRKLNVKQKQREENIENDISMVYTSQLRHSCLNCPPGGASWNTPACTVAGMERRRDRTTTPMDRPM